MDVIRLALTLTLVTIVTAELGVSNIDHWAYQWYEGDEESFKFTYVHHNHNASDSNLVVEWTAPGDLDLTTNIDNDLYEVTNSARITNAVLLIKKVTAEVSGVYICHVMTDDAARLTVNRTIFGINIHDKKYRSMSDKYSRNIAVAFIATAVFVVPFLTICLTYRFSWENRQARSSSKNGGRSYMYTVPVKAKDGGYDNPIGSTNL